MDFYHNQKLAWLCIPKNASTSLKWVFDQQLGWQCDDLYEPKVDLDSLHFFGCLREPDSRHTMGVAQYLMHNNCVKLLDDYPEILASCILDEHSMPLHFLIPQAILDRCTFFVIDDPQALWPNYFVSWLMVRGIDLQRPIPWLNSSRENHSALRQRITAIKEKFPGLHNKLTKWAHTRDMVLYARHIKIQHTLAPKLKWNPQEES